MASGTTRTCDLVAEHNPVRVEQMCCLVAWMITKKVKMTDANVCGVIRR
jgi:hypothetical protein